MSDSNDDRDNKYCIEIDAIDVVEPTNHRITKIKTQSRLFRLHKQQRLSKAHQSAIFDQSPVGIVYTDMDLQITNANIQFLKQYNYRKGDFSSLSQFFFNSQKDRLALEKQLQEQLFNTGCIDYEMQTIHKNESLIWTRLRGKLINQETCRQIVWTLEDITHKNQRQDHANLAATVYQVSSAAMLIMDAQYKILNINPAFTDLTGYSLAEIKGNPIDKIYNFPTNQITREELISSVNKEDYWRGELLICRKTNERFPGMVLINCIKQFDGNISHYVVLCLDISNHKQLENELRYHAEIDPLTSLPNRKLLFQRLDSAFASAKRFNYIVALLYLDLDGFKQINDSLGHGQGDKVLIEVAKRLTSCVRKVDTAARLGGDEFVVILNGTSKEMIADTARRIIYSLTLTVAENDIEREVSASIGIAIYPQDSTSAHTLLKYADEAMYRAKYKGKRQFCWHEHLST